MNLVHACQQKQEAMVFYFNTLRMEVRKQNLLSNDISLALLFKYLLGITWKMLHNLDYASYPQAKHDYIVIPLDAKTNSTRFRWWQPFVTERKTGERYFEILTVNDCLFLSLFFI